MVYYEMCMERKPYQGYTIEEHQKYVWEKGDRPLVASYYLPEGIDKLLMGAWAHRPEERLTIDEVCHKTQALLMDLDSCLFWDQAEDEFLFEVYANDESDDVSELGEPMEEVVMDAIVLEQADVRLVMEDSDAHLVMPDGCLSPSSDEENDPSHGSSFAEHRKLVSSAA